MYLQIYFVTFTISENEYNFIWNVYTEISITEVLLPYTYV